MKRKTLLLMVSGLAAALVAGGLYASNMAFKLDKKLFGPGLTEAAQVTLSATGQNSIGIPFNPMAGLNDAEDLLQNINAEGKPLTPDNVLQVAEWRTDLDGFVGYTGTSGTPFPLNPCWAYLVQVQVSVDYDVVGTHDPAKALNLMGPPPTPLGPGTEATSVVSLSGQNFYGYPYHSTAGDAEMLIDEINDHAGQLVVLQVAEWRTDLDGFIGYTGTSGSPFPLHAGDGYLIQVAVDVPGWVPSHF